MNNFLKLVLVILIPGFIPFTSFGQVDELEVLTQKTFIEAKQQKLLGNFQEAISLYREVLKQDKENAAAYFELARIHDTLNQGFDALKAVQAAIKMDPDNDWYKKYQADLYQKTGKNQEAAEVYAQLASKHPENEYYYLKWAYFLVKANDINKALKVYDQLENRIGINEEIIRRKHSLYLGTGNNKKAAKELKRLVEAFPSDTEYMHLLADFYTQTGEQDAAKKVFAQILKTDPGDSKAQMAMAGKNIKNEDDIQYLNSLKTVFSLEDIDLDLKIGKLIPFITKVAETGDVELAETTLQLADFLEKKHPNEAKVFAVKGDLFYHTGRLGEAKVMYQKTLELDDSVFLVWQQLLYIFLEKKDFISLEQTAEQAIDVFPNKSIFHFMSGLGLLEQAKPEKAIDAFETGLMMSNRVPQLKHDILVRLGQAYAAIDSPEQSDEAFDNALKIVPEAPEALKRYSLCLAKAGRRLEEAAQMATSAEKSSPKDPGINYAHGLALYKQDKNKKAKIQLEEALKKGGNDVPEILELYGDVYFRLGDKENAASFWSKAKEKGGESTLLNKKIIDKKLYE